jgi:phosphoribosyl 1,2-cyclic phosphodiesterase
MPVSVMAQSTAKLVFWGVRGSTPTPERENGRYGGNTPCVELQAPDGTHIILDCGTGLRALGNRWSQSAGVNGGDSHILVTHYHWDHLQGIPFFHPFFESQNHFYFYSFESRYLGPGSLRKALESQLASPYFPIDAGSMASQRTFRDVVGGESWQIGGVRVTAERLNHPQGCLGYRLDTTAGSIVYATDNEPDGGDFDRSLRRLARDADVLIYDAQYSPEQLASTRRGWGHSSWLEAVKVARDCKVNSLLLFHHDPDSSDRMIDGFLSAARQEFPATWAATEGMSVSLSERGVEVKLRESRVGLRRRLRFSATVSGQDEDGTKFEEKATVRDLSLLGAYLCLNSRPRLQSELRVVIEAAGDDNRASALSFRGTVIHCDVGRERTQNGIGVLFVEETEPGLPRD